MASYRSGLTVLSTSCLTRRFRLPCKSLRKEWSTSVIISRSWRNLMPYGAPCTCKWDPGPELWVYNIFLSIPWSRIGVVEAKLHPFLTSALDGGEWLTSQPGLFSPREIPYYQFSIGLGVHQSRSGRCGEEKNLLPLPAFELRTVQPVANRYTDFATPAVEQLGI